jgi:hypothetical protein
MSGIRLMNRHLTIDAAIAAALFPGAAHLNIVFYPNGKTLLMADAGDEIFKGLHKTSMQMLKDKNLKGDKSMSLEEILIDHDLDDSDRELGYKADAVMKILTVYF